jgi:hypothetical protein
MKLMFTRSAPTRHPVRLAGDPSPTAAFDEHALVSPPERRLYDTGIGKAHAQRDCLNERAADASVALGTERHD